MPEIGEIKRALEIGRGGYERHQWVACPKCGKERWVSYSHIKRLNYSQLCFPCWRKKNERRIIEATKSIVRNGSHNPAWKGGRTYISGGYIAVYIQSDDFFFPMVHNKKCKKWGGYVLEHRLVMAKHLSRCLLPWEVVHHKNGTRDDNRLENLELLPSGKYHVSDSLLKSHVRQLTKKVFELETENKKLREAQQ